MASRKRSMLKCLQQPKDKTTPSAQLLERRGLDDETQVPDDVSQSHSFSHTQGHMDESAQSSSHTQGPMDESAQPSSHTQGLDEHETPLTSGPPENVLADGEVQTIDEAGTLHVRTVATTNDMWTIPKGEKIVLEFNTDWQPTGTSRLKFRRLAGQYIRSGKFVTIREKNWKLIPRQQKEDLWAALMKKFYIGPHEPVHAIKRVAFMDFAMKRRQFKSQVKYTLQIKNDETSEQVCERTPKVDFISDEDLKATINVWVTEPDKERAAKNSDRKRKHCYYHTTGSMSYSRLAKRIERQKGVAPSRSELFEATHTKKDGTPVNQETGEKIEEIREFMTQEPTTSGVSTQGSISWYPDDPYARAMKKPEYSGCVRGTGLGPIHASSSRSLYRSTSEQAYQSHDVVAQNEKIAAQSEQISAQSEQIAAQSEQLAAQSAKIAVQEAHMVKMQKILETIMANSETGNAFVAPGAAAVAAAAHIDDTCSPGYVRPKSSVGSRPGEYLGTSQDDGHTDNA